MAAMLSKNKKSRVINEVKRHESDTGSTEVQASIQSKRIDELAKHLKKHPKDTHSRRGLLGMVATRQKTLKYLKKKDEKRHGDLIKKLGLKK